MAVLHVMSANLSGGKPWEAPREGMDALTWKKHCIEKTAQQISRISPHIIAFQDINDNAKEGLLYSRIIAAGNYRSSIFAPSKHGCLRKKATAHNIARGTGIALASVYPIMDCSVIDIPSHHPEESWLRTLRTRLNLGETHRTAIFANVNVGGQTVLVATAQLSPTPEVRAVQQRFLHKSFERFARGQGQQGAPRVFLGEANLPYPQRAQALTYPALHPESQNNEILAYNAKIAHAENTLLPISDHRAIRANIVVE
ncbi:hypothetical protein [Actinotignum urinale]|uniref:Endonuclease/exonuclease/phosphatase domain-containing protein n=1 Tax=Actinotignum urinale TaxID=190146 RepID=A0AAW9HVM7_9ACTO|nr:hypothetical protein [Actinotignum urinale]MDY5133269.1 hypothetical protein [Actinotignum urinale]MDY5154392.1 hypothetical protein [Actinotignum urinale]MDY5160407.1 hypothetical protein [Actinotignum urinale]WIK59710.1 hypothetical protein CJ184_003490 [Actinotignum urinale]